MDYSLHKLLKVNRGRFKHLPSVIPPYVAPPIPVIIPVNPPVNPPPISSYTKSDFGDNVINNHYSSDAQHSSICQTIFNYITKDYRNVCTSFESYKTPELNNTFISGSFVLPKSAQLDVDLIYIPYVNAAYSFNMDYQGFVLAVGSHHSNAWTDGNPNNSNRFDITANENTFLQHSVAVGARRDTPSLFMETTSYGFGMEFFEDCSPEALDPYYPNKDIPVAFAELLSNDGVILYSNVHLNFANNLNVGDIITIKYNPSNLQSTTILEKLSSNSIKVSPISPISSSGIYGYRNETIGGYLKAYGGQAQSWAVPIVAGKLKVIKMTTMSDWDTVRAAARATAKRNPTGIPEIDNTNWDMYRGFGCIDVQGAIAYINDL